MLTKEQLEKRKKGVGGSDIGVICGYTYNDSISSKSRTVLDIYLSKVSDEETFVETEQMFWGNKLEDPVADVYAMRSGKACKVFDTVVHPEHEWVIANVDRLIEDGGILECKTADSRMAKFWGEPGTDQIPKSYLAQVAWYCMALDAPYADIAVLIGGNDFRVYTYKRTPAFELMLFEKGKDFWFNNVQKRIPPAAVSLRDVDSLYKISGQTAGVVEATAETYKDIEEYLLLEKEIKEKNKRIDELKLSILKSMDAKETLVDAHGQIIATYKSCQRKSLDKDKVKSILTPEDFDACFKSTTYRVFKPKNITDTE